MRPLFATFLVVICLISQSFFGFSRTVSIYPVFDSASGVLPRNFRTSCVNKMKSSLDTRGLNYLKASGSGQFSEKSLTEMLRHLALSPEKVVVMDLRQESHGFINGQPISWKDGNYNYGNLHKSQCEIESDEFQRLNSAVRAQTITVNRENEPTALKITTVKTERAVVETLGCQYIRLPVTDLNRPSNEIVDQFIDYVKTLPEDQWVHFHCKAGKGRTTTFMTMLDIMRNGQCVDFDNIIARQKLIGGSDLTSTQKPDMEKSRAAVERFDFVKKFYLYCRQVPDFTVRWSDWIDEQQPLCANP